MVPSGHAGGTKLPTIWTYYKRCKQVGKAGKSFFFSFYENRNAYYFAHQNGLLCCGINSDVDNWSQATLLTSSQTGSVGHFHNTMMSSSPDARKGKLNSTNWPNTYNRIIHPCTEWTGDNTFAGLVWSGIVYEVFIYRLFVFISKHLMHI